MRLNKSSAAKGKATDLERIRNNQRRCRARQKEYIASLEDKIRQYEGMSFETTTKQKLEELALENRSLKRLLQVLGLRDEVLDAYSNAVRIAPDISWPLLGNEHHAVSRECSAPNLSLDRLEPHMPPTATHEEHPQHTAGQSADISISEREFLDLPQTDVPLPWEFSDFHAASASSHIEQYDQVTMDALMTEAFSNTVTADDVSDTTTLCTWAFSLVLKSNLKGYSAADLDLKLRAGYKHGVTPTEGCRIDNKVLLNVLAEIM
ncbi:hypothetical protein C7974DRAFT_151878 [Boeremia exigua]|uniref:uncharacterized protein n=1 Tax=Boeremia exigua TaxID=749465 RepID=UPI001E8E3564|nr:uncharacterized protein C7974DRAFT_151878 [Boeremia exigua]KAH6637994.1 hypothetical protein C7974DRAFT_151878 [Boeremia exigua]